MFCPSIQACVALQVEKELAEERVAAEAETKRAQEAIQAKQRELQQIEQQRQHEVHNTQQPSLLPSGSSLPSPRPSPQSIIPSQHHQHGHNC